jgi:hypothetical protein
MSAEFFHGRRQDSLRANTTGRTSDVYFAGERFEGKIIEGAAYENCTFANVSLKDTELRRCQFKNCVFLRVYLRRTRLLTCELTACKFISCEFPGSVFDTCKLLYVAFERCYPELVGLTSSLPQQANLLYALTANLSREAESLGESEHARDFKLIALKAREQHLRAAWRNHGDWYKKHFVGLSRVRALWWLFSSRLEGFIWGYGEHIHYLLGNLLVAVFLVFPGAYFLVRAGFELIIPTGTTPAAGVTFGSLVFHSMDTVLTGVGLTNLRPMSVIVRVLMFAEVVVGLIGAGLIVTYLFRTIVRRSLRMLRT